MTEALGKLPTEPADRFTKPLMRFLRIEATAGGVLLLSTVIALVISNSPWSQAFESFWALPAGFRLGSLEVSHSLKQWINDGLMTFFFFVVALEMKREVVTGELRSPNAAILSLAAALGGMLVPAGVYLALAGSSPGAHGWGTVMATDTAFMIGGLAVLGSRIPHSLRLFLLSLAIFDDVGAILVIALGYSSSPNWLAFGVAAGGLVVVAAIRRLGVRHLVVYFALGGAIWLSLSVSGFHPTLAGIILGLMTPARSWVSGRRLRAILDRVSTLSTEAPGRPAVASRTDLRRASVAAREAVSRVEQLEMMLHPWVAFLVMPLFALANAGFTVSLPDLDGVVVGATLMGLAVGKPVGVLGFTFLAVVLRLAKRPPTLPWSFMAAGAMMTGIGFTMSLFIADLAFDPSLLPSAKLGILLASLASAVCGLGALTWLTFPARARPSPAADR
jgi:NhaA family Na+:H+ antiporter